MVRKIIHVDMDAFFASVEQREHPELKGKAVIVGGDPWSRGVVCTCSYEARRFGVHAGLSSAIAVRRCPQAKFLQPNMKLYARVSEEIFKIFHEYTDLVEKLSVDEAFLDVTENKKGEVSATRLARAILDQIWRTTGLTASAGVSYNLFLAKVASGWKKPHGLTVIPPEKSRFFLEKLPIEKFYGIGSATAQRMKSYGIFNGRDLLKVSREHLIEWFGKPGGYYYDIVRGKDDRMVQPYRIRKSLSKEETFPEDLKNLEEMDLALERLSRVLEAELIQEDFLGRTVTLKVRYADFSVMTRSLTLPFFTREAKVLSQIGKKLLRERTSAESNPIRLLGIGLSNFVDDADLQHWFQLEFSFVLQVLN